MNNMPANDNTSNQYFLLTHLYQYFGSLLNCSAYGTEGFPEYMGEASQFNVHRFMVLDAYQVGYLCCSLERRLLLKEYDLAQNGYFVEQVGLAAASFGVSAEDVTAVGSALLSYFNVRCSQPVRFHHMLYPKTFHRH